uniref:FLYWCH-type domain-containing protein n=1 Tax=Ditylenchus dipsaci TaxID=166011 RepID=A0A915CRR4_9BILA
MRTLVLCDGYEMRHDKSNTLRTIQYWRCLKKFCSGRAKSEFAPSANRQNEDGCHFQLYKATIDVISSGKEGISDAELLRLPNDRALQRMIQHVRQPIGASSVDKPLLKSNGWTSLLKRNKESIPSC